MQWRVLARVPATTAGPASIVAVAQVVSAAVGVGLGRPHSWQNCPAVGQIAGKVPQIGRGWRLLLLWSWWAAGDRQCPSSALGPEKLAICNLWHKNGISNHFRRFPNLD